MDEKEANALANHIALWSANDQMVNHKEGLHPRVQMIGNGTYVVILRSMNNYHVWSWLGWKREFEPELELEQEEDQIA